MGTLHYGIQDVRLEGLKSPGLIKDFVQLMAKVSQSSMSVEGMFLLFSHDFVCLSQRGNKSLKSLLEEHEYVVGHYWSPEKLGIQEVYDLRISSKQHLYVKSQPITDNELGILGYVTYIHLNKEMLSHVDISLMTMATCLNEMSRCRIQQRAEGFNRHYIETRKACFLVVDNDGFITYGSPEFFAQFETAPNEIINGNLFEYFLFPPKIKSLICDNQAVNGDNVDFDFAGQLKQYKLNFHLIDDSHRILDFAPIELATDKPEQSHRLISTLDRYTTDSPLMQRVISVAKESVKNTSPIYILGEEGTGKRSLALTIHNSCEHYSEGPFIAVNLHSVKPGDLSALLLGTDDGEGAKSKFELANGGTLYIERIDLLPGVLQAALTHIILTKTLFDINTNKSVDLNFRLITSSIKPLEDLVHERRFCPSLYYYLTGASLVLPNLQKRTEDIPMIVEHKLSELYGGRDAVDKNLLNFLLKYACNRIWSGNISELAKWIEHTFLHRDSMLLDASSAEMMSCVATPIQPLEEIEKREIANALVVLNRQYVDVSNQLGISLSTLRRKITKYSL
ncbi:sigma 54-interacting transcriptional regulator [Vibrio pacinii]|uniref:sigma 54-interacting transcriptional regulator n=1 Tax=Vibrio pacinii TaxID=170674 RepID=UPI0005713723|nr:sigma 54-interacting transcriptional regulator [Vibrio pacinii]